MLEKSLIRYGNHLYEKSILPIFALYDNRLKFSAIRANIKSLKARIRSGKESRMMMKILRKTVKGNEKKIEKAQEKRTMTPPSSDNEDESEYEMSFSSKGQGVRSLKEHSLTPPSSKNEGESESEKSCSSKGRGVRTQQEHFLLKSCSSKGRGVRTQQEYFLTKSCSSKGRGVRTQQEPIFLKSWSSKGRGVRTQQEPIFPKSCSSKGRGVRTQKEQIFLSTPRSSKRQGVRTQQEHVFLSRPLSSKRWGARTQQEPFFTKPWSSKGRGVRTQQEQFFNLTATPPSSSTEDESDSELVWSSDVLSESLDLNKPSYGVENTHGANYATTPTSHTMSNYLEMKDSGNGIAPPSLSTENERDSEISFNSKGQSDRTEQQPKSSLPPVLFCDINTKQPGSCSLSQLLAKDSYESDAEVPVVGSGERRRTAEPSFELQNEKSKTFMVQSKSLVKSTFRVMNTENKKLKPFGLVNLGNTCYMNSTIQSLHTSE